VIPSQYMALVKIWMTGARLHVKMSIKWTAANRVKGCHRLRISDWSEARDLTSCVDVTSGTQAAVAHSLQRVNMANIRNVKVREIEWINRNVTLLSQKSFLSRKLVQMVKVGLPLVWILRR